MHQLLAQAEGAPSHTDAAEDINHDENFILIGRYHIVFDKKNIFSQTLLLPFFFMLYLIIATNVDPVACKATFSWTRIKSIIQLALRKSINLPLQIFEMIYCKANIISTNNLSYGVTITMLLLAQECDSKQRVDRAYESPKHDLSLLENWTK